MNRICDLPYESQRELASFSMAAETFRARSQMSRASSPAAPATLSDPHHAAVDLAPASFSYALRRFSPHGAASRPRLLVVSPFAVYPARHGGARRIAGLLKHLRRDFDVILVSDEASLYESRSFTGFDDLCAVHLVWRVERANDDTAPPLETRMRAHCHEALADTVRRAVNMYEPALVQIEYAELAGLIRLRGDNERWILGLHDAATPADFASADDARRFTQDTLNRYDAVTVCSEEDRALMAHRNIVCVPNASSIQLGDYRRSESSQLLFMGPFRYAPNFDGVRRFLRDAFPAIAAAVPGTRMCVLGGDDAARKTRDDPVFAQGGVEVVAHRDDVGKLLNACAITVNPLSGIRGSSIKVIESLTAGRVCVSTRDGARGFLAEEFESLIVVRDIASMVDPIVQLLRDSALRHRIEAPDRSRLARYRWSHSAERQRDLYDALLGSRHEC